MMSILVKINIGLSILVILLSYTPAGNIFYYDNRIAVVTIGALCFVTIFSSIVAISKPKENNRWISIVTLLIGISPIVYFFIAIVLFIVDPQP